MFGEREAFNGLYPTLDQSGESEALSGLYRTQDLCLVIVKFLVVSGRLWVCLSVGREAVSLC